MSAYNKVILMGNLTREPSLKYLPNDTPVCECGIATNTKRGDKEETCFVDFAVFGKAAETFKKYMAKGRAVLLDGRLRLETWDDKQGNKRSKHTVIVNDFTFISDRGSGGNRAPSARGEDRPPPKDEDIPF